MATPDRTPPVTDTTGASATRGTVRDSLDAQHSRYGGIKWGAAFFGWLSANGLAVLLIALISAAGVAIGLTEDLPSVDEAVDSAADSADTIGIVGGIVLLVILFLAYLAGGYVAGRMARFDGMRQGIAVWLIGLLIIVALTVAGLVFGSEYNVLAELNLPRIPVDEGTATTGGIIALVALLLVTLLGAILGGKLGDRYHRKVDRVGIDAT
jgi:MFS family permease